MNDHRVAAMLIAFVLGVLGTFLVMPLFTGKLKVVESAPTTAVINETEGPWQAAAKLPYATNKDLEAIEKHAVTECRDNFSVVKVTDKEDTKYLHLNPLCYIAFKLHMQEKYDWQKTVLEIRLDLASCSNYRWALENREHLCNERLFMVAAQLPILTGKEIHSIHHPTFVVQCNDGTNIVQVIDGDNLSESFLHLDKRWYEMLKTKANSGESYVLGGRYPIN